ncbi:MAG TPA: hypothetical protein VMU65_15035 [Candidatus Saccharimonadales bacterium]|nr:hypothetical protein [Candidatus Saccharimonadales bacterium]
MAERQGFTRATGRLALDRSPQVLPVPLGGLTPARRHPSTLLRHWWRHQPKVMMAMALVAGICSVWLALIPPSFTIAMDATGVHVDGAVLRAATPQSVLGMRVFRGPASLAITASRGGASRAGAVMTWGGVVTTGRCVLVVIATGASDTCRFTMGSARLSARDTFDARAHIWHRVYGDGADVTIAVPAGSPLIPIPFPLGH